MIDTPELGHHQRAALALWLIMQRPQTTAAIARRVGMDRHSCQQMLSRLAGCTPIYYDYKLKCWSVVGWELVETRDR